MDIRLIPPVGEPSPAASAKQSQLITSKSKPVSHRRKVSLFDLGLPIEALNGKPAPIDVQSEDSLSAQNGRKDQSTEAETLFSGTGFSSGSALKALNEKNTSLYQFLYRKIDGLLTYPSELIQARFQGSVAVRMFFDENGDYDSTQTRIQSSEPYLKVHVIRILRKALTDPLPEHVLPGYVLRARKPFYMDCLFNFEITQNNDSGLIQAQKFIVGKKLFFYRSIYISKLEWSLGPLKGLGPFAAGLDVNWVLEKSLGLVSKKAEIDPLQKYRDDPEW